MLQHRNTRLAPRATLASMLASLMLFGPAAQAGRTWNKPPVISGSPASSVAAGTQYYFQPAASDPEGARLYFRVTNLPAWASFNSSTGRISGTPAKPGTYASITISVSDGRKSSSLAPFSIAVVESATSNRVPTISGTASNSIEAGKPYAFRPKAYDADGDVLTFTISGKPAWASFDRSNGTLHGTPGAADAGSYANIVIAVSDGKSRKALPAFTLTVTPAATRSVTVKWHAPTQNTDGTPLTGLSGYKVFYGTASHQYSMSMYLAGADTDSVVVEDLAPGTYYFSVQAVNSSGVASSYAQEVVAML